jgi:ArsR family transcriptional regulator
MSIEEQTALFAVLSDPTRLKLLRLLAQQQMPDALCVNALAYRLGVTQSAVSQHLRILKAAGLVKGERRGFRIHYFIDKEAMARAREQISTTLKFEHGETEENCPGNCTHVTV